MGSININFTRYLQFGNKPPIIYIPRIFLGVFIVSTTFFACIEKPSQHQLSYSTQSDSALHYYHLGWNLIMDDGFYGPAETSYRKALAFDNEFLIGKATLARLTLDLDERLRLYKEIEQSKSSIKGDERLILDVYQGLVHFTNVRAQDPDNARSVIDSVLIIAEHNLRQIVHRYPYEDYLKSEYLEILNSNYGAITALDSLNMLCTDKQKIIPFLLGFAASLSAEAAQFEEALNMCYRLREIINDPAIPKSYAVYADVYLKMDSLNLAQFNADKAVELDPRNLDASRLKIQIDNAINN